MLFLVLYQVNYLSSSSRRGFLYKFGNKFVLLHFYERLGDIVKIKKAPKRRAFGLEMRGIDIKISTDDMELFRSRVNEMFNGQSISYLMESND